MPTRKRTKASARASKPKSTSARSTRTAKHSNMDSSSAPKHYKKLSIDEILIDNNCEPAQSHPTDISPQSNEHTDLPPTFTSIPSEPKTATSGPLSRHARIASAKDLKIISPPRVPIFETTASRAYPTAASACPPPPDFGRTLAEPIYPTFQHLPWDEALPLTTGEFNPDPALQQLLPCNRSLLSMPEEFQFYAGVFKDYLAGPTVAPQVQDVDNIIRAVLTYVRFGFSFEAIAEKMEAVGYALFDANKVENIWNEHAYSKNYGQANIEEDGDVLGTVDGHLNGL
ncbi:MAG: hypothetical protein Q9167_003192 [Letrouitia subvulpina]